VHALPSAAFEYEQLGAPPTTLQVPPGTLHIGFKGKEGQVYPVQTVPVVDPKCVVDPEPPVVDLPLTDAPVVERGTEPVVGRAAEVPHSGHEIPDVSAVVTGAVVTAKVVATPVVGGTTTFPQGPSPTYGGLQAVINGIEITVSIPGSESDLIKDGTKEVRACQNCTRTTPFTKLDQFPGVGPTKPGLGGSGSPFAVNFSKPGRLSGVKKSNNSILS